MSSISSTGSRALANDRILVVDDERDILQLLSYNLEKEGYEVDAVRSGEEALEAARTGRHAAIVLDLMLPGLDGLSVCRRLKEDPETRSTPVIVLTAKSEESDVIAGLELGADDYVTKPFSPRVLVARVRAALRRGSDGGTDQSGAEIQIGSVVINASRHEVHVDGRPVELSATEFAILALLAHNPGWVFSRQKIIDEVKGSDYPVTERAVDVQVLGIRRKLGESARIIQTVRGVGYRLQAE